MLLADLRRPQVEPGGDVVRGRDPGGQDTAPGSLGAHRLGEHGALEVAADTDPPVDAVRAAAVYGFVDYAALWSRGGDRPDATLGSAGVGFRAFLDGGFAVDAALAAPIDRDDAAEDPGTRLFVSLRKRF